MLVTQRAGSMVIVSANGAISQALAGIPAVAAYASGQGGLLDVAVDPNPGTPGQIWVYYTYSRQAGTGTATAVNRGRLDAANFQLLDGTMLFQQTPAYANNNHFGSRLAFRSDGTLFITLGDRQQFTPAQDLTGYAGKVVRINRDGTFPSNNPNLGAGAAQGIWSYGHRNPQGAAIHPTTGALWITEHGPQGGDELNLVTAGGNYGWPNRSYGCDYGVTAPNCQIGGGTHAPTYVEPVSHFPGPSVAVPAPSIAPSSFIFYTGDRFPEWRNNIIMCTLAGQALWRIVLNGNAEVSRERITAPGLSARFRAIKQGPDGWIYVLTTRGTGAAELLRIER